MHGKEGNKLYLVFEYIKMDIKKYLDKRGAPLAPLEVKNIMW